MNQQQEARRAAAQAFIESLEQLEQTLESVNEKPSPAESTPYQSAKTAPQPEAEFDLNVWEEAIADIDQFIQKKNDVSTAE